MSVRAAAVVVAAALVLPVLAAACDDTNERRTAAIYKVRGASSADADEGAAELQRILEKNPKDRYALIALAGYYERRGRTLEAHTLYRRVVDLAPNTDEGDQARRALASLDAPSTSAAKPRAPPPPPPLSATAIFPGKGLAPIGVGSASASAASAIAPCELVATVGDAEVCDVFSRGVEIASKSGKVTRIGVYREGREHVDAKGERHAFRGFVGETPDGVAAGMPEADALAKLGPPAGHRQARAPLVAKDGSFTVELLDYPKKGMTLEIDATHAGRVVGAIEIPTVEGRPWPSSPGGKP